MGEAMNNLNCCAKATMVKAAPLALVEPKARAVGF